MVTRTEPLTYIQIDPKGTVWCLSRDYEEARSSIVRLEGVAAQAAAVVRLKFYGGLNDDGVAGSLGISERTVRREWAFARGWLRDALERDMQ